MIKTIFAAVIVSSLFALPTFASESRCMPAAAETVQSALRGTSYVMGKIQDESSAGGPAVFDAEIFQNQSMVGMFVVVMDPTNCAVRSKSFENANP